MKNIDFLPEIYRQRAAAQKARLWWGVLVLVFGAAIGSTAVAQQLLRRSVEAQFNALGPRDAAAQQQVRKLADLHSQNQQAADRAALVTYLDHPWPRTQLLAEVVRPLPETIRLTELTLVEIEETRAIVSDAPPQRSSPEADAGNKKLPPAAQDLEDLRKNHDQLQTVIEITGQVPEIAPLHAFVAAVGRSPLVAKAQLKSIESVQAEEGRKETRFTLRVLIKSGYGLPGILDEQKTTPPAGHAGTESAAETLVAQGGQP